MLKRHCGHANWYKIKVFVKKRSRLFRAQKYVKTFDRNHLSISVVLLHEQT